MNTENLAFFDLIQRPRRNRRSPAIRRMVRENRLSTDQLVLPLFVRDGDGVQEPISSMPGCFRFSIDLLLKEAKEAQALGIPAIALFPLIEDQKKDKRATESLNPDGLLLRCVKALKDAVPDLAIITDVAMDPYSSDGHDGYVENGFILNDPTLEILAQMAVAQAKAGADIVAPSDMMDGRVGAMRAALDTEGFSDCGILAYSAKYASAFYGPFRDALDSAPRAGDKKTYQMDPANQREALREVMLDVEEGADMVMVKPAAAYLDIISAIRQIVDLPVAAYHVSGEFAMIKAAAERGWLNEEAAMMETTLAIRRAGADIILTYFAKDIARLLQR
ncbi:MAG: porphobilinogen synthase [Myxococcales bacterium]|nr:porphobilinogen synthase [Myxococcales bacterium]MCB9644576.1 porphobilinogen synthase [Myxococcales bacterium]